VSEEKTRKRRLEVVRAARLKWKDRRIALEELHGVWTLKGLTGIWSLDTTVDPPFAREASVVYWQGRSLEEAEQAVRDG